MTTTTVHTVRLGTTDLEVSPIAFGTWQLGGEWGQFDEEEGIAAIRHARELGVNLFDTAQGYGFGASERLLGIALRDDLDRRRDEVVIATKGGLRMTDDGLVRDASPGWLRSGVEDSLRALEVDHVDIYQVHWPDPEVPFAETAGALGELVDEGKIRHIGWTRTRSSRPTTGAAGPRSSRARPTAATSRPCESSSASHRSSWGPRWAGSRSCGPSPAPPCRCRSWAPEGASTSRT